MTSDNYTKRELDREFKGINNKLDNIQNHVRDTNGKVADMKAWKEQTKGALKVGIPIVVLVLLPFLTYLAVQISSMETKISDGVAKELKKYEIEYIQ